MLHPFRAWRAWIDSDRSAPDSAKLERIFPFFVLSWLVLWTVLPSLCVANAYIDVAENFAWGQHLQLGYDKNPYFGAWLTYGIWNLIPSERITYLLSQISVAGAAFCVWFLGKRIFRDSVCAFAAVLLMLAIPFFSHSAAEFNDDVMEIGLWAVCILFFYRAVLDGRITDWLVLGLSAGLAMMTKYLACALLVPLGALLIFTVPGRKVWKTPGPYLAAAVFALICLPNVFWLFENDFISFRYASMRAGLERTEWIDHLRNPLKFLLDFSTVLLIPFGIAFLFLGRGVRKNCVSGFDAAFLSAAAFGPAACSLLFSLAAGGEVLRSWTTPYFIASGLFVLLIFHPEIGKSKFRILCNAFAVLLTVSVLIFAFEELVRRPYLRRGMAYETYDGREVARWLDSEWNFLTGTRMHYVIALRREACNQTFYGKDHPAAFFDSKTEYCPWIRMDDVMRRGAVAVWDSEFNPQFPGKKIVRLGTREFERAVPAWFRKLAGKPRTFSLSAAVILPEK